MTPDAISFAVYGVAAPAGSKRSVGKGRIIDANKNAAPWKREVASAAVDAIVAAGRVDIDAPEGAHLLTGPLSVVMTFYVVRPKGHYGTGRVRSKVDGEAHPVLRPSAPLYPTRRPDVLKLARAVEDACTGIIWRDDSQIVTESLAKRYGEPARVEVIVSPVEGSPQ